MDVRVLATRPQGRTTLSAALLKAASLPLQVQRLDSQSRREEKGAGPSRRRDRQRAGTRPVCRGCYSGLMIVAPPGPESNHSGTPESHSESAWESSEED